MIAVQVLSQTASSNPISSDSTDNVKTSIETTDVVSLLQEQIASGTQMYSLQISGQTIPFTTIQLPMLQPADQNQSSSTSSSASVLPQLTGDISQTISSLGVSSTQLGLTCTTEKDRSTFGEGKEIG